MRARMNWRKYILSMLIGVVLLPLSLSGQETGKEARFIIDFRHNDTVFDQSYFDNSSSLKALTEFLNTIEADSVKTITITGWASPEGIYERNMLLSRKRAVAGANLIKERFPNLSGKITTHAGGESWGLLRERVVADSNLSAHSSRRILKFLDEPSISNETRKWRLINWLGYDSVNDQLWLYLLRKHYRYIRACEITVVYNGPKEMPEVIWDDLETEEIPGQVVEDKGTVVEEKEAVVEEKEAVVEEKETVVEEKETDEAVTVPEVEEPVFEEEPMQEVIPAVKDTMETAPVEEIPERVGDDEIPYDRHKRVKGQKRHPLSPILGISTNLLYDLTYIPGYGLTSIPDVTVEYYPKWGNWSAGFDVDWPMWQHPADHRYMQINNISVFTRYYFKPDIYRFNKGYVFGNINGARYGIGWNEKGWVGEGIGISAGAGYKKTFGRFFIDFGLAIGFFYSRYDPYVWGNDSTGWYYYDYTGDPLKFETRRMALQWFGLPTRVYISIGYDKYNRHRRSK